MSQREKWLVVAVFVIAFGLVFLMFAVGLDDEPKPARTPGAPLPTGVQCDPSC